MPTIAHLKAQREALRPRLERLANADTLTPDEERDLDRLIDDFEQLSRSIVVAEESRDHKIAEVERFAASPGNLKPGSGAGPTTIVRHDPWTEADRYTRQVDRGLAALERADLPTEARERLEPVVRRNDDEAEVIAAITDPDYTRAYERFLQNPMGASMTFSDRESAAWQAANQRAAMTTTGVAGIVPAPYDPSIVATNDGSANPWRDIARVERTTGSTLKITKSAGTSASFASEGSEVADGTPSLTTVTLTPQRAHAFIYGSLEAIEDARDLATEVSKMFADAKDRLESTKFHGGLGDGVPEPWGLLPTLASNSSSTMVVGTSGATSAATLVLADVYALDNALPERHQPNARWLMGRTIGNQLRSLAAASNSANSVWNDLGAGQPPLLLGHPVAYSSAMDTTITSGSNDDAIVLGDFSQFVIVDRIPAQAVYIPYLTGSSGRPTGQAGWYYRWRTTSYTVNTNGFRYLRL